MIRQGRIRLALICAVMTSSVLILLMALAAVLAGREYRAGRAALLQSHASRIVSQLLTENRVSNAWMEQMELSGSLVLSVEDNGSPLFFRGVWKTPTNRNILIERARETALRSGFDPSAFYRMDAPTEQTEFTLRGDYGDTYRAVIIRAASPEGRYCVIILNDLYEETRYLTRQRLFWAAMTAGGVILFSALSWLLAGIAVRPIAANIEQQNAFVAAASHELRSPLAVIGAAASAIHIEQDRSTVYADTIAQECARLGRLMEDLLLLAHSGVKSWTIEKQPVNLDTLLIETVEQFRSQARAAGHRLELRFSVDEELPPVMGDAQRLKQILANLVTNAICYAGGNGPIEVWGKCEGKKRVAVEITDHGKGIPDQDKPKMFRRFTRGDAARTGKSHFGLGLSIAAELARLHGGSLILRDTPGGGCTFILSLPAEDLR